MAIGLQEVPLVGIVTVILIPLVVVGGMFWFLLNKRKRPGDRPGDNFSC